MTDIVAMYQSGLSCRDIGRILGLNDETIRKRLVASGVPRRPRSHKKPKKIPTWNEYFSERTSPSGDCIIWIGTACDFGYGRCNAAFAPGINFAHRMSWFLAYGKFDLSKRVLHKCDVPGCVNPDHLWLGTQRENIDDMVQKNRQRSGGIYGELNGHAKLTEVNVIRMRELRYQLKIPYYKLGPMFGVTTMTAYRACSGQSWSQIASPVESQPVGENAA